MSTLKNGPFAAEPYSEDVRDSNGDTVARGYGKNEAEERAHARMVADALNAAYYLAVATGSILP